MGQQCKKRDQQDERSSAGASPQQPQATQWECRGWEAGQRQAEQNREGRDTKEHEDDEEGTDGKVKMSLLVEEEEGNDLLPNLHKQHHILQQMFV